MRGGEGLSNLMKVAVLIFALSLAGCGTRQQIQAHPAVETKSVGSYDEEAYAALTASHELIEKTKVDLATSATGWTAAQQHVISAALAYAIDAHELTQKAYMAYRKAVIGGLDSRPEFNALADRLHDLDVKTAALKAARNDTP